MADPVYRALLIGNSTFPADAHNLQALEGPVNDVALLRAALTDRQTGLFDPDNVRIVPERTSAEILVELEQFFGGAKRDDVLLLYYSGHGLLNDRGQLFLCTRDTRTDLLKSTSVSSSAINMMFDESTARTTVIVLDCCHSGAFKGGTIPESLKGRGRFLLTSSRSTQLANDADRRNGTSLFTTHLAEGLTGAADANGDGYVDLDEVFAYARDRLEAAGRQRPQRNFSGDGTLALARAPARSVQPPAPGGGPVLALSRGLIDVGEVGPDDALPPQQVFVRNAGSGRLDWTVDTADQWLQVERRDDSFWVTLRPRPGANTGRVVVRDRETGATQAVTVLARVREEEAAPPVSPPPALPPPAPADAPPTGRTGVLVGAGLGVVALLVVAFLVLRPSGSEDRTSPTTTSTTAVADPVPRSLAVPSTAQYTDTGIDVRSGQVITVAARGEVDTNTSGAGDRKSQPDGIPGEENREFNLVQGVRHGALIGRIGTGQPFLLGASRELTAPTEGRLYLGINDAGVENNAGAYQVTITVR